MVVVAGWETYGRGRRLRSYVTRVLSLSALVAVGWGSYLAYQNTHPTTIHYRNPWNPPSQTTLDAALNAAETYFSLHLTFKGASQTSLDAAASAANQYAGPGSVTYVGGNAPSRNPSMVSVYVPPADKGLAIVMTSWGGPPSGAGQYPRRERLYRWRDCWGAIEIEGSLPRTRAVDGAARWGTYGFVVRDSRRSDCDAATARPSAVLNGQHFAEWPHG